MSAPAVRRASALTTVTALVVLLLAAVAVLAVPTWQWATSPIASPPSTFPAAVRAAEPLPPGRVAALRPVPLGPDTRRPTAAASLFRRATPEVTR